MSDIPVLVYLAIVIFGGAGIASFNSCRDDDRKAKLMIECLKKYEPEECAKLDPKSGIQIRMKGDEKDAL